jgi:hypothetical protein
MSASDCWQVGGGVGGPPYSVATLRPSNSHVSPKVQVSKEISTADVSLDGDCSSVGNYIRLIWNVECAVDSPDHPRRYQLLMGALCEVCIRRTRGAPALAQRPHFYVTWTWTSACPIVRVIIEHGLSFCLAAVAESFFSKRKFYVNALLTCVYYYAGVVDTILQSKHSGAS